ncbi:MAG: helix-turn-helix domain-containing protein [candidate division Zixibacteria bacterium]|nr:helix-turn-helix domain-containing protein [candidate division Zixibacteria bacterium]
MNQKKVLFDFGDEDKENPIGSLLRYAREKRNLDIDEIAETLKVRRDYLVAMEEGRFDLLPARFYRRSFLKAYAEYLKLDAGNLLKMLEEQEKRSRKAKDRPPPGIRPGAEESVEKEKTVQEKPVHKADMPPKPPSKESAVGYFFSVFLGLLVGAACLIFLFGLGVKKEQKPPAVLAAAEPESVTVAPEPPDTIELFMNLLDEKIGTAPEMTLRIEAAGRSWMAVVADRRELFTGYINQSMNVEFKATDRFSINVGVNEGLRAWLNGFELIPIEWGVTYLNRENFKEFIPTDNANEIVRAYESDDERPSP